MLHTRRYVITDPEEVKRLIRQNPWATFVAQTSEGLVASHYPVILDETEDGIVLISHFGKPEDVTMELGEREMLVIIQGPHGYISSSWYEPGDVVPTWNHMTAHLYGTPEILSDEENYAMLDLMTNHFEQHHQNGRSLAEDPEGTRRMAKGTAGLRMRVTRFEARAKLSQNKSDAVRENISEHLEISNPALAAEMGQQRAK